MEIKKRSLKTSKEWGKQQQQKTSHIRRICNQNGIELLFQSNNGTLLKARKNYTVFKIQSEIKFQPRILYPAKLSIEYMTKVKF